MKITEITVFAGRTFNHPFEAYSNFKPSISLKSTLEEGDDAETVAKQLQAHAEDLMDDHKRDILERLEAENERRNADIGF
jgi:hypothetical protein